jgi:glycosyltransferase involved in cell wall biosynthesis
VAKITVLIPCRDGADTLRLTLSSLKAQTVGIKVVVADDASVDSTSHVCDVFGVNVVKYPRREPKDYKRVPFLVYLASKKAGESDYFMISGDDDWYPADYIEKIVSWMERDGVDMASGYGTGISIPVVPTGAGRIISNRLWKHLMPPPREGGWEGMCVFKAEMLGFKHRVYPIQRVPLDPRENIRSLGHHSYVLGFPFVYILARGVKMVRDGRLIRGLSLVLGMLEYMARRFPKNELAPYVNLVCKAKMKNTIMKLLPI